MVTDIQFNNVVMFYMNDEKLFCSVIQKISPQNLKMSYKIIKVNVN